MDEPLKSLSHFSKTLSNYQYTLPANKIAKFPLKEREAAKLLVFSKGHISHETFSAVPKLVPQNSILFFNDTKVIPARIFFNKESGAQIEIFLLQPEKQDIEEVMLSKSECLWQCIIGNLRRWGAEKVLKKTLYVKQQKINFSACLTDKKRKLVRFSWDRQEFSFWEIIEEAGEVPLPPYIKRKPAAMDKPRYQTVYSLHKGAVAAPTAGLHFTKPILDQLRGHDTTLDFLTLHVGAGTFQPIKDEHIINHNMHCEQLIIHKQNLINLLHNYACRIAIGTTAMRTLESVYWYGVKLLENPEAVFRIEKLFPYQYEKNECPTLEESISAVLKYMDQLGTDTIGGETEIFIFPGYHFKVCNGLITNFHMPGSTLILLVAAFVGDAWKDIYEAALQNDYRFLSYGDTSLLFTAP